MKKFFIKVFILFLLLAAGIGIIAFMQTLPEYSYNLAIIDKQWILANAQSPKIVLAGGSNLAFGIDSETIQNKFNRPVINMGLHAGLGLGRILDNLSPFLNSGDILLIVPEYSHFTSDWNGNSTAYEQIFDAGQYRLIWSFYYGWPNDNFFSYLSAKFNMMPKLFIRNKNKIDINTLSYSRDGFNEYGDYVKHLEIENQPFDAAGNAGIINQTYLKHFFQIVDDFSRRGIIVVLSYPCYEEQSFRNSVELIQELNTLFMAKENLLVISTPESYCYPVNYFYDTVYHLNNKGRSMRTSQLIQDLQASGLLNIPPP
jgi:hypothetical protein